MAVTDVSELRKKRQQKRVLRFVKKLAVILAVAAAAAAVILTKDMWYPKLDGILTKIPTAENTSELAGGSFPISIDGGASYQLEGMDNAVAVLDDSHFIVYNYDGKEILSEQHTFANPILTVSSKKALIYDLGGTSFSLMSKYKTVYSKTTDSAILIAKLGSNDYTAVVTKDDKFLSKLMIYDGSGNNIFNYGSVERIIDVTFDSENSGCYITAIGSKGGVIVSKMLYYRFDRIDYDESGNPVPVWETDELETLAISVRLFGSENIIVFGDNMCAYYDLNGQLINYYEYGYTLSGYSSDGSLAALIFANSENRNTTLVTVDGQAGEITEVKLDYSANSVQVDGELVFVHSKDGIYAYSPLGELSSSVELESDYDDFRRIGSYIFLMGYDEINRIDFR
ncbi:MAG: DUF5711 family protein [Oscillospiraceae bacterium]|nr:DUF5711 family protein [Oscillospiraceae bacterium]